MSNVSLKEIEQKYDWEKHGATLDEDPGDIMAWNYKDLHDLLEAIYDDVDLMQQDTIKIAIMTKSNVADLMPDFTGLLQLIEEAELCDYEPEDWILEEHWRGLDDFKKAYETFVEANEDLFWYLDDTVEWVTITPKEITEYLEAVGR